LGNELIHNVREALSWLNFHKQHIRNGVPAIRIDALESELMVEPDGVVHFGAHRDEQARAISESNAPSRAAVA
jgi:hypothetical protein